MYIESSQLLISSDVGAVTVPTVSLKTWRHRKGEVMTWGHLLPQWQNQDPKPGSQEAVLCCCPWGGGGWCTGLSVSKSEEITVKTSCRINKASACPSSTIYWMCNLWWSVPPPCASVFSSIKWEQISPTSQESHEAWRTYENMRIVPRMWSLPPSLPPFLPPFYQPPTHSPTHPSTNLSIHLVIQPSIRPSIHPVNHLSIHTYTRTSSPLPHLCYCVSGSDLSHLLFQTLKFTPCTWRQVFWPKSPQPLRTQLTCSAYP